MTRTGSNGDTGTRVQIAGGCLVLTLIPLGLWWLAVALVSWNPVVGGLAAGVMFLAFAGLILAGLVEAGRRRRREEDQRGGEVNRSRLN